MEVDIKDDADGRRVGCTVREYPAPAGNCAIMDYSEEKPQGGECNPVSRASEHTAFADSTASR